MNEGFVWVIFITICARDSCTTRKLEREDGEYGRLYEGAEGRNSRGTHGHSLH